MKIIDEYPINFTIPTNVVFSCLLEKNNAVYGIEERARQLYIIQDGSKDTVSFAHPFYKITCNPTNQTYLAICRSNGASCGLLYLLSCGFQEIDLIKIPWNDPSLVMEDIWFDAKVGIIFVVTSGCIQKYNCNGDYLGVFMSAPKDTRYKAICTMGRFLFIAYEKCGCIYVASYTDEGIFIERMSLGGEYWVCNLQIVAHHGCPLLRIYAIKTYCYPYFIDIQLECKQPSDHRQLEYDGMQVECINENEYIHTTCHIGDRPCM